MRHLGVAVGSTVFVAAGFIPTVPLWLSLCTWGFFGLCGLVALSVPLRRVLIARIDAKGLHLGGMGIAVRGGMTVPWDDVATIVVWKLERGSGASKSTFKMLGVITKDGVRDLADGVSHRYRRMNTAIAGPMANASRVMSSSPDYARMAEVLTEVAPHVGLHDWTTTPTTIWRP
ncbi:hypothetical protein [Yinghuangia soli]|uniref:Uncharacterized protein n=1 Tax=Yinghuangia soli TaxID=2908204 RepID=A0AA41U2A6_9ACTN|nr:hypothetical protein [Yinghuangia soli]MCF2526919.1 hypothetical protein [Yinghuangia soli]